MKTLNIIVISMIMLSSYAINATTLIIKKSGPEPFSVEITFIDGKTVKTKTIPRYYGTVSLYDRSNRKDRSIKALKIHSTQGTKEFDQENLNKINKLIEGGLSGSLSLNIFINDKGVFAFEVHAKIRTVRPSRKSSYRTFEGKL